MSSFTRRASEATARALSGRRYWKDYGHRLRITRLTLGITEMQASTAHGVTVRTYRRWEAGCPQRSSHAATLKFSKVYDVSLDWLINGEGFNLGSHLAVKPGGKLAILPITSAARQRRLAEIAREGARS